MLTKYPRSAQQPGDSRTINPFWIDVSEPTEDEIARINAEWGLRVPSRAQLEEIETSSRLRCDGGVLYLSMPLNVWPAADGATSGPVGFVFSGTLLITVRFADLRSFARVATRVESDIGISSSAAVFTALVEEMADVAADTLEKIAADLVTLSRETFRRSAPRQRSATRLTRLLREGLVTLGNMGETLSQIRESLLGLGRILDFTGDMAREWLGKEIEQRLKTVRQDLTSLSDFEDHLFEKIHFLLDALLGFVNAEQNDIFKVLTIASVVGIPPTLIASMYGMNFHNMPELSWQWGYAYGLTLIALSTVIPILWFKRRGWW
jgi:magnesium transporter